MQNKTTYKSSGILATIMFHVIIALLFVYYGFRTPLPLPPEEGILVNFGVTETGKGAQEPMPEEASQKNTKPAAEPVVEDEKSNLTQNYEDAPVIKAKEVVKKKPEKKPIKKTPEKKETQPKKETKPIEPEVRKPNPNALYKGRGTNAGSSEGITEGKGNQGNPEGSPNSNNYTGGGKGNSGIKYDLEGRNSLALPAPAYNSQVEGTVIVEITVDKDGNVTNAVPGVKGSTTLDGVLLESARQAALKARFNRKPDAPAYQKGKITYIFKLQ